MSANTFLFSVLVRKRPYSEVTFLLLQKLRPEKGVISCSLNFRPRRLNILYYLKSHDKLKIQSIEGVISKVSSQEKSNLFRATELGMLYSNTNLKAMLTLTPKSRILEKSAPNTYNLFLNYTHVIHNSKDLS